MDRTKAPQIQEFGQYTLSAPTKMAAANGIPFYYFPHDCLELLHFSIVVKAGFLYQEKNGVAATCYGVVCDHPRGMTSAEFSALLDSLGATFGMATGISLVKLNVMVPKRNALKVLQLVFGLLQAPCFDQKSLDLRIERAVQDWKCNQLRADSRALDLTFQHLFAVSGPLHYPLNEALIRKVTLQDIADYYARTFCAENISFFAAGSLTQEIMDFILHELAKIKKGAPARQISTLSEPNAAREIFEKKKDCTQSAISLCKPLWNVGREVLHELMVLNTLLGGYFGSRLMTNLREVNGYTYGINSELLTINDDFILLISSEVAVKHTRAAIEACRTELQKLVAACADEDEMQSVRNYVIGKQLRGVDGVVNYMKTYIAWHARRQDESEFYKRIETARHISAERVQTLAAQYLQPDTFSTIIVGEW